MYKPIRPPEIDTVIKQYTNLQLPHYFQYAKDKTEQQTQSLTPTTVNYLDEIIGNPKLKITNTVDNIDYKILMHNPDFVFNITHTDIVECYDYYNSHKWFFYNQSAMNSHKRHDTYIYQQIKKKLLELPFSKTEIIDALVYYLFTDRKTSLKKTFWECFGEEIYENILKNVPQNSKICPICGKRIHVSGNRIYCGDECYHIATKEAKKKRYKKRVIAQI